MILPHSLTSSENEFLMQHFFLMFCAFFRGTYFSITVLIYSTSMRLKQSVCIIGFSNPPPQRSSAVKPYLGWRRLPNWSALPLYKPSRNFQFENRKGLNLWHFWPIFKWHFIPFLWYSFPFFMTFCPIYMTFFTHFCGASIASAGHKLGKWETTTI